MRIGATTAARALLAAAMLVMAGSPARAHVVYGTPTLRQLAQDADVVVRARVVDAHATVTAVDPPLNRPAVEVEVLEVLDGALADGNGTRLVFVQHGNGVPTYAKGDEVVLFLHRLERVPELARTRLAGLVDYVSQQESAAKIVLTPATAPNFATAIRAYATVRRIAGNPARLDGLRRLTVKLLASEDPWLAASALRDLVVMSDAPLATPADAPALTAIVDGTGTGTARPIGFRVGLLTELERRGLVDRSAWLRLLRGTSDADRIAVVRGIAAHPSPELTAELIAILDARPSSALAAEAAVALGVPGNDAAVPALARALGDDDRRVRSGAIRGLGRIATPAARRAIELAAAFQPDGETRRRARAEATLLGGGAHQAR